MATKSENLIGILIGSSVGAYLGYKYAKQNNIPDEEKWKYGLSFGICGALGGYLLSIVLGTPIDTVNYKLVNGKRIVYQGITYEDRVKQRRLEHKQTGKIFTKMIIDKPKSRNQALIKEKGLIKKHKPLYNIQHNS